MRRAFAPRGATAAAVSVLVALIAGGGYALANAGSGRKITVCVSHKGGTLYKAKRCAKHDKKLSWNQVGPRGATGATGSQGQTGNTGPQGPGAGYLVYNATGTASATETPIGTLGPYTFTGTCQASAGTTTAVITDTGPGGQADGFTVNGAAVQAASGSFGPQTDTAVFGGSDPTNSPDTAVESVLLIPTSGTALNIQQTVSVAGGATNTCHWSANATPAAAGGVASSAAHAAVAPRTGLRRSGSLKGLKMLGGSIG